MSNFLSFTEESELKLEHRKSSSYRIADRIKAVLLSNKKWSNRRISEVLLIDEQTVSRHILEYKSENKLSNSSGGSSSKLDSIQTLNLISHLEEETYVKASDICVYINNQYGVNYTVAGITSWLYHNGFSYKKPKGTPHKADIKKQEDFIKEYNELLATTPTDEPILFGDGVHPTMATKISYGWIKKGEDKTISTTASRTRINLMGAINLENMQVDIEKYETINSESMIEFFDLLKRSYSNAPKIHIILDRGPYNISALTHKNAEERNIIIHLLPPYSPNLNPIERLWKVMNEYSRNNKVFSSAKEFKQQVMDFFNTTWPSISNSMRGRINDNFQEIRRSKNPIVSA